MNVRAIDIRHSSLFIDGVFRDAKSGETITSINPATGETLAEVPAAGAEDVADALAAATRAAESWASLGLEERTRLLRKLVQLIDENRDYLAILETLDTGKPYRDVVEVDIPDAILWFDYFADIAQKLRSDVIPTFGGYFNFTLREPYGVVGLIIPWNYPLALCGIKMAPALAMGNAVVLKPAEETPLSALALAALAQEAGFPDGVVNVVPGLGPVAGTALVSDPRVGLLSFTGSTEVGREVMARAARHLTPVVLELGGKSPNVVFADADLDLAVRTSVFTFCVNQGQLCTAGSRLLVDAQIHDEFVSRLVEEARQVCVGDPFDSNTQLGALVSAEQLGRVERYVEAGKDAGAVVLEGGARELVAGCPNGFFYRPTVFDAVEPDMEIAQEEIFGPVLSVISFSDEDEAVQLANRTSYGLAAGIWTNDLRRAHRFARNVNAGLVYVNTMNVTHPASPYGGFKQSGIGVEGGFEHAISFTRLKSIWINIDAEPPQLG